MYSNLKIKKYEYSSVSRAAMSIYVFFIINIEKAIVGYCQGYRKGYCQ